ncbi:MAG: hypothetical protein IH846_05400 [Acidobacteria bacterium]|nr:hypothetical protein [Acidobacteriota bacterium]
MTVDEELFHLEESLRRLKIEFDIYFNGGSQRPPTDSRWRVENLIKKYADAPKLTYAQRFRYNGLAQRYSVFSDLWRKGLRDREEGPRQTGSSLRAEQKKHLACRVEWRDPASEPEKVDKLFEALVAAKRKCGENAANISPDDFRRFVQQKTAQLKRDFKCDQVQYVVEVEKGQVKLKAKGL